MLPSNSPDIETPATRSKHPHQEVIDALAVGVLRLLFKHLLPNSSNTDKFGLGFCLPQSVTTNPDNQNGVQP